LASRIKLQAFDRAEPAEIVRLALPMTLTAFAEKHGFSKAEVSQCLSGYRPHEKIREALRIELEATREELDQLLDGHRPPESPPAARSA
jgi:hypothetical protein